jgi:hypothetical protein
MLGPDEGVRRLSEEVFSQINEFIDELGLMDRDAFLYSSLTPFPPGREMPSMIQLLAFFESLCSYWHAGGVSRLLPRSYLISPRRINTELA